MWFTPLHSANCIVWKAWALKPSRLYFPSFGCQSLTVYQQGWLVNATRCHSPTRSPRARNLQINFLLEAQSMASHRTVVWLCGETPGVHSSLSFSSYSSSFLHFLPPPYSLEGVIRSSLSIRPGWKRSSYMLRSVYLFKSHLCFLFLIISLGGRVPTLLTYTALVFGECCHLANFFLNQSQLCYLLV